MLSSPAGRLGKWEVAGVTAPSKQCEAEGQGVHQARQEVLVTYLGLS